MLLFFWVVFTRHHTMIDVDITKAHQIICLTLVTLTVSTAYLHYRSLEIAYREEDLTRQMARCFRDPGGKINALQTLRTL